MMRSGMRFRRTAPDMATCREAMRHLQSYLDGEVRDEVTSRRIARHLEVCRECGLQAETLAALKQSLRRLDREVDQWTLGRLRSLVESLAAGLTDAQAPTDTA